MAIRDGVPSFEDAAAFSQNLVMNSGRGAEAVQVNATLVSANFFRVLGARPAVGRFFADEESRPPDGAPVVVLGYGYWQRRFGGDPRVVGRLLPLGKGRYTIVGVAPKGLTTTDLAPVDVWLPVSAAGPEDVIWRWSEDTNSWLQIVARLRPGADARRAAAELETVYQRVDEERVRARSQLFGKETAAHASLSTISGMRTADGSLTAEARISRWLIGVTAIVLLIACANVANLLLARATRRRREIAVRLALGISRRRLVGQLMTEGLLLAALGGVAGLALARWGGGLVRTMLLPGVVWEGSPVGGSVIVVTAAIGLSAGALIAIAPALPASSTDLTSALKAAVRSGVPRSHLRRALIVAQSALSVVLLVGAGLFVRSLRNVRAEDLGMDMEPVLRATIDLESAGYSAADRTAFLERAMQRLRRLPGVDDVAMAKSSPFGSIGTLVMIVPGRRDSIPEAGATGLPTYNVVSPSYFATLGMRIIHGRGFTDADGAGAGHVAVINETLQRFVWPEEDPIGRCVHLGHDQPCTTIVGIVKDAVRFRIREEPGMQIYLPFGQDRGPAEVLFVRTRGDPARLVEPVRHTLQTMAPDLPYADVRPMQGLLNPQIRPWKLGATMFGLFGLLALVIASVGLYSTLAYDVAQRTHEMGVRMALGARSPDVVRLVLGDGVRVAAVGVLLGLVATLAAGRAVAPLLFDTSPHDPHVLLAVSITLLAVAVIASFVPAWRATRVAPGSVLQAE